MQFDSSIFEIVRHSGDTLCTNNVYIAVMGLLLSHMAVNKTLRDIEHDAVVESPVHLNPPRVGVAPHTDTLCVKSLIFAAGIHPGGIHIVHSAVVERRAFGTVPLLRHMAGSHMADANNGQLSDLAFADEIHNYLVVPRRTVEHIHRHHPIGALHHSHDIPLGFDGLGDGFFEQQVFAGSQPFTNLFGAGVGKGEKTDYIHRRVGENNIFVECDQSVRHHLCCRPAGFRAGVANVRHIPHRTDQKLFTELLAHTSEADNTNVEHSVCKFKKLREISYLCVAETAIFMGKRHKENPVIEGLEITALAAEGKAMGHWDGVVVFVPGAVPGDMVDVQVRSKRRRFMEAYILRLVRPSPLRVEPFCEHFGVCGGCSWQNLPYEEQLRQKQQQVVDQLTRIGHLELPEIKSIIGSANTRFYRNKLEFTFAPRRWVTREEFQADRERGDENKSQSAFRPALGFHVPGMFDKVLDINKCWLQPDPSNAIRLEIKRFCIEHGYSFYDIRAHEGLMRNVVVRTASTGEVMVIVVFAQPDCERIAALMNHLKEFFPEITSLQYIVNTKLNDSLGDQTPKLFAGRDHIFEQMEGLRFKIGPKSFYQTNSEQAYELYKVARELADLSGTETVYDLYTGTGTIANFVAREAGKVVGIEYVEEAIEDARENSALNGIANTTFFAGDMRRVLTDDFIHENGHPDVVILDPPRAGVDAPVIEVILRAAPEAIVYVSCNPATQARDIALMASEYALAAVQPVDMFPHTHHVENVVKLKKIKV